MTLSSLELPRQRDRAGLFQARGREYFWPTKNQYLEEAICFQWREATLMGDNEEARLHVMYASMNAAFCARMRLAIVAGLECPPIGVVTTPGTRNPIMVAVIANRPLVICEAARAIEQE
jgi:hypothetical protein